MIRLLTLLTKKTTRASTLVETTVSMAILLSILTLFFTALAKIEGVNNPHLMLKAHQCSTILFSKENLLNPDQITYEYQGFKIEKQIIELKENELYHVILFFSSPAGKPIYERSKMISKRVNI